VRAGDFSSMAAHDAGAVPAGVIAIRIEAGSPSHRPSRDNGAVPASAIAARKRRRFARVLDLGCGTGGAPLPAAKLWREPVLATDIDPIAVEVARENARANEVAPLVRAAVADGLTHPAMRAWRVRSHLRHILAAPLTWLAPTLSAAVRAARDGRTSPACCAIRRTSF